MVLIIKTLKEPARSEYVLWGGKYNNLWLTIKPYKYHVYYKF